MTDVGDILTINREVIAEDGSLIFKEGQKVEVRNIWFDAAHYSRRDPFRWIPKKLKGVRLVGHRGIWFTRLFKELNNEPKV
jgi:hypothetical protein